jgi:hypothetical protein
LLDLREADSAQSRLGGSGSRHSGSPFSSRPSPASADDDFSYIIPEDLAQPSRTYTPYSEFVAQPGDDLLLLKNKDITYPIKFPAYSICDGKLQVRDIKIRAAAAMDLPELARFKLIYKGQQLKDDYRPCREYNIKNQSEILCIVGEVVQETPTNSHDGYKSKSTSRKKVGGVASEIGGASPESGYTDSGYGTSNAQSDAAYPETQRRDPESRPETRRYKNLDDVRELALAKLETISARLHTTFLPLCVQFTASPPTDPKKNRSERIALKDAIINEVLFKLDAVETEGYPEVREKRKALVRETQGILNELDESVEMGYEPPKIIPKTQLHISRPTKSAIS